MSILRKNKTTKDYEEKIAILPHAEITSPMSFNISAMEINGYYDKVQDRVAAIPP